jgi:hypothetical protein
MPIEFRCHRCHKLLRTPDNTAGKQAQCPMCGELQPIPPPSQAPEPAAAVPPMPRVPLPGERPRIPEQTPFAGRPAPHQPTPAGPAGSGPANPYQSPLAGGPFAPLAAADRSGPPWESKGPSLSTFLETSRDTLLSPPRLFAQMRREGGWGRPAGFAIAASLVGVFSVLVQLFFMLLLGISMPQPQQNEPAMALLGYVVIAGCALGMGPLLAVAGIALYAAVYHALLSLAGGANFPFEATFRVVAYSHGAVYLLYLIPCCGAQIASLAVLPVAIIGLSQVHEITGMQAATAVLPPAVLCCGVQVGTWVLMNLGA